MGGGGGGYGGHTSGTFTAHAGTHAFFLGLVATTLSLHICFVGVVVAAAVEPCVRVT